MNDGPCRPGGTVLLTGLPSTGKTTIAIATRQRVAEADPVEVLDGDDMRGRLWPELLIRRGLFTAPAPSRQP
ncbi:adenylyl-sulfate kinase [Nocardia salmonicida]|uniref:adenylyl-sulfate kinase n=1 Tax=Nocardia salmonicida TaxID=53431 RepID=UPI00379E41AD